MGPEQKTKILEFLKKENLANLAYNHGGQPRAAVIDFSETEELEIIFTTLLSYRKYESLKNNPKVAFVFGGKDNITLQYEGIATELGKLEFLPYLKYHLKKNPIEAKFAEMLEARFFKVKPTWIRYANYGSKPNEIFELTF
jgi:uncharacterized pyridoxamine 5'-phosphate oxidase family protein